MKRLMARLTKTFLAGLAVGIPLIMTLWIVVQAGAWLNGLAVRAVNMVSPSAADVLRTGLGLVIIVVAFVVVILLMGLAARFWFTAGLLARLEHVLERVPLVKTVYTSIRDMLRFFGGSDQAHGRVVLYRPGGSDIRMLALVTNERPIALSEEQSAGMVTIWLPMSYNLGGYMLYVPADTLEPTNLSVEDVLKLTATAELGAGRLLGPKEGLRASDVGLRG
jgi:uncharacterized membrane protein